MMLLDLRTEAGARRGRAVTVGAFDGVHVGHQHLIERTLERASQLHLSPLLVTFWPLPKSVLLPEKPLALTLLEEKLELLKPYGTELVVFHFDLALAAMNAEEFLEDILIDEFKAKLVAAGAPFRFGHDSEGDVELIRRRMKARGGEALVLERVKVEGHVVSSTRTRKAVSAGDVELAHKLLGRPYYVRGEVRQGLGVGASLGFPTANLAIPPEKLLPAAGVYAALASCPGEFQSLPAVCYVGRRPTVSEHRGRLGVEVHLLGKQLDLYGKKLQVDFLLRLRKEQQFDSPEALALQLAEDCKKAETLLPSRG